MLQPHELGGLSFSLWLDAQSFFDEIAMEYQVNDCRHSSQLNIPNQN